MPQVNEVSWLWNLSKVLLIFFFLIVAVSSTKQIIPSFKKFSHNDMFNFFYLS